MTLLPIAKAYPPYQSQRSYPCRTSTTPSLWDYNDASVFQTCKSHFCSEKTQWQITTFARPPKNQKFDFRRLYQRHPVSTLTDAAQHIAGKRIFCQLDCSQAYHCLQMADQRSIEMLAFIFASRTFAYCRLAQGLSRALSAFSSFMREYLDRVNKVDQCAQYVDDIGIAANSATQLINNLRATFECIRTAGLKLTTQRNVTSEPKKLTFWDVPSLLRECGHNDPGSKTSWRKRNFRNSKKHFNDIWVF